MAVLVTGGAGFIGSHMVLSLLDAGKKVVVLDNLSTGFRWAVPDAATLVVGDVGDQDLVRTVIRKYQIDAIIHFAGSIVVPESVADPLGYYNNNTVKSRALIQSAVETGVKNFIFSSTAAVYGNPQENPVFETAQPAPMSPYGFDRSFDQKTGYRTKSMLCAPLVARGGDVVGVIQLINKKRDPQQRLHSDAEVARLVVPFDQRSEELLVTLASQAGIALENAVLYEEIRRMLEGFVAASVEAIEQRDPTTSGHSRRVADLTVGLARAVERELSGR